MPKSLPQDRKDRFIWGPNDLKVVKKPPKKTPASP